MLPKFADVGAAKTPIGASFWRRCRNEVGEIGFDVRLDGRPGTLEVAQTLHLVGDELIVGRALHGQEALEEIDDCGWPVFTPGASAGLGLIARLVFEVVRAQLIEPGATHAQASGCAGNVQCAGVEILEDTANKGGWQAMSELFLCTSGSMGRFAVTRQPLNLGALPPNPRSLAH